MTSKSASMARSNVSVTSVDPPFSKRRRCHGDILCGLWPKPPPPPPPAAPSLQGSQSGVRMKLAQIVQPQAIWCQPQRNKFFCSLTNNFGSVRIPKRFADYKSFDANGSFSMSIKTFRTISDRSVIKWLYTFFQIRRVKVAPTHSSSLK